MATRPNFSWLADFTETQLLLAIRNDCTRITNPTSRKLLHDELDRLVKESKKPYGQRDHREVKFIWRRIQPDLRYYGILNTFDQEPMKSRLVNFLKGVRPKNPNLESDMKE